jgi:short-subunit dehydrogenase
MTARAAGRNLMIVGASRGLGAAFSAGLPDPEDRLWLVSRTRPAALRDGIVRRWVRADLARPQAPRTLVRAVGDDALDVLIYSAGIWEETAFTRRYRFETRPARETRRIVEVNLTAALLCIQVLLPALRRSRNPKLIVIASLSGVDNATGPEVAFTATNFARRGLVHALREELRRDRIPVTAVNPGVIASSESPWENGREAALRRTRGRMVPMHDLVDLLRAVLRTSRATCVKEIDVPALLDWQA